MVDDLRPGCIYSSARVKRQSACGRDVVIHCLTPAITKCRAGMMCEQRHHGSSNRSKYMERCFFEQKVHTLRAGRLS